MIAFCDSRYFFCHRWRHSNRNSMEFQDQDIIGSITNININGNISNLDFITAQQRPY